MIAPTVGLALMVVKEKRNSCCIVTASIVGALLRSAECRCRLFLSQRKEPPELINRLIIQNIQIHRMEGYGTSASGGGQTHASAVKGRCRFLHWLSRKECSYASFKACAVSAIRSDKCAICSLHPSG